jgi:hypothetical protein
MADIARMDDILSMCIRDYGFKVIYERLMELAVEFKGVYEKEVAFLNSLSIIAGEVSEVLQQAPTPPSTPLLVVEQPIVQPATQPEVKVIQISERAAGKAEEAMDAKEFLLEPSAVSAVPTSEGNKRKMKRVIHKNGKVIPVKAEPVTTDLEDEVVVAAPAPAPAVAVAPATQEQAPRKTAAEIKKWQRGEEAARRAYMKKNKISRTSLMTVENMRNWLSNGQTYAWIAREQLGCKEEDVSKFAKENGLSRKKN